LLAGCNSSESQAQEAYGAYQAAVAAGDLQAARGALSALVGMKDDDPRLWEELGRVQLELKDHEGAYYAFSRAHELDRGSVSTLASLTQLALLSGDVVRAEEHAKQLELVSPGHPAVKLAYGYVHLQRQNFDKADEQADALLQAFPYEPGAKLLKARILVGRDELDAAIKLLKEQVKVQPQDIGSWRALMLLSERQNDWRVVGQAAARLQELNPGDSRFAVKVVDAALRSNDFAAAQRASEPLLSPQAPPRQVDAVLDLWAKHWKKPEAIEEARRLAQSAPPQHRLAYATYFNEVGRPEDAAALVGNEPRLPVDITNRSANAVIATSLALRGKRADAKRLFDRILEQEPDHVYALRGRASLEIATGNAQGAIVDAQRLVSIMETSVRDRLLLARAFAAAGDSRQVDQTLWDAFHDIPGDFEAYEVLRARLQKNGDSDAIRTLEEEFRNQRDTALSRELI
jgi:predicted Zn-dependent protease